MSSIFEAFTPMHTVIPEGQAERCKIEHFTVSEDDAKFSSLRSAIGGGGGRAMAVRPGTYARLDAIGTMMMTDTHNEMRTNIEFLRRANGEVLIAGLGIGMVLLPALRKPEVKSVLVIEKYQGVITLVEPWIRNALTVEEAAKLTVVCADIMDWKPPKGEKWDTIYFDIWPTVCTDNLDQITTLNRRYARRLNKDNPNFWKGSWEEASLRYQRQRERREESAMRYTW